MVEGTPLLREHVTKSCIEGSNPSFSANKQATHRVAFLLAEKEGTAEPSGSTSESSGLAQDAKGGPAGPRDRGRNAIPRNPSCTNLAQSNKTLIILGHDFLRLSKSANPSTESQYQARLKSQFAAANPTVGSTNTTG